MFVEHFPINVLVNDEHFPPYSDQNGIPRLLLPKHADRSVSSMDRLTEKKYIRVFFINLIIPTKKCFRGTFSMMKISSKRRNL